MSVSLTKKAFNDQFKKHAVVDLNHVSPELRKSLDAAGVKQSQLEKIAGVDGQIKGAEFKKLFTLLNDGFDPDTKDKKLHLEGGDGGARAAGDLNQAFLDEVARNRKLAQYGQPGEVSAPAQPRLTVANNARSVDTIYQETTVQLGVESKSQREFAEENGLDPHTACRATAQHGIEAYNDKAHSKPLELAPREQSIQVAYAEDTKGRVVVDETQAQIALDYIDKALTAGYPVLVGVSHKDLYNTSNDDRLTDHWLTIDGRGYDDKGRVYYEYKDPGNGGTGRFYVEENTGQLFKEGNAKGSKWERKDFEVSRVRTYKGLD